MKNTNISSSSSSPWSSSTTRCNNNTTTTQFQCLPLKQQQLVKLDSTLRYSWLKKSMWLVRDFLWLRPKTARLRPAGDWPLVTRQYLLHSTVAPASVRGSYFYDREHHVESKIKVGMNSWFRKMVARETFNKSRGSIPIAAEDSVTATMRSDKFRHTWLCWYYSSWIVMVKRRCDLYKTYLGYLTNDSMVRFIPFPKPNTQ